MKIDLGVKKDRIGMTPCIGGNPVASNSHHGDTEALRNSNNGKNHGFANLKVFSVPLCLRGEVLVSDS
jgi:hypothetical protein